MYLSRAVKWLFDELNRIVDILDDTALNSALALAPWLAPVAPATISYQHLVGYLSFDPALAFLVALAIEILGAGALVAAIRFWRHNREHARPEYQLPVRLPALAYVFYLVLVTTLGAVLLWPWQPGRERLVLVWVVALLVWLGIPSAMTLAARQIYKEMQALVTERKLEEEADRERKRLDRREAKQAREQERALLAMQGAQGLSSNRQGNQQAIASMSESRRKVLDAIGQDPQASQARIGERLGITRQAVGQHIFGLEKAGYLHKNGNGYVVNDLEVGHGEE